MLQSFAYYVSILRKDFTEYCSNQLSGAGLSPGQLYFILYVGVPRENFHRRSAWTQGIPTGP